jgi:hypothetical protein
MLSGGTSAPHTTRNPENPGDLEPLRRQVSAIIETILVDTKPEGAPVRQQLRQHVANNPGRPEKALLSHLLSVSTTLQDDLA